MPDPAPPRPGYFRMYPRLVPDVPAGSYVLEGDVELPGPVEQLRAHVEVVSPRFVMPPDQILSTFPPALSRGAYSTRLPQVVLRRRTLPWERPHAPGDRRPWLALVLLADGEAELRTDVSPKECVTPGRSAPAPADAPKAAYVEVPERVLRGVFPTQEDIALLCHVRQVDLADTELAMGDDDGWVAVVLANRLPRPDTSYLAVLVSVEGQVDLLPKDAEITSAFDNVLSDVKVLDLSVLAGAALGRTVGLDAVTSGVRPTTWGGAAPTRRVPHGPGTAGAARIAAAAQPPVHLADPGWATERSAAPTASVAEAVRVRVEMAQGFAFPAALAAEPTYRFPALAYWRFTNEGDQDFESLARRVDVALLGDVRPADAATPPPDAPPGAAAELPADPRTVLSVETGHVGVEHLTRRGDSVPAWYRGPLVPQPVERVQPEAGQLPLAHHADQVRIVTPDGREDVSYAAAFEIGRLLALSSPSVGASLAQWRQEAFGAARVRAAGREVVRGLPDAATQRLLADDRLADPTAGAQTSALGARIARGVVHALGDDPAGVAPARPAADPGLPAGILARVLRGGDKTVLAGLGLGDRVDPGAAPSRLASALLDADVPSAEPPTVEDARTQVALRAALEEEVGALATGALHAELPTPERIPHGRPTARRASTRRSPRRDALDELLDRAAERRSR
jgi:hypothetical protein